MKPLKGVEQYTDIISLMFLTDHFGCNVENVFITINEAFISQRLMDSPHNIASQKENESKGYQKQTPISLNSESSTI